MCFLCVFCVFLRVFCFFDFFVSVFLCGVVVVFFCFVFLFCFQCLRKKICGICDSLLTCLGFCGGDDGGGKDASSNER